MANHPNRNKRLPLWEVQGNGAQSGYPVTVKIRAEDYNSAYTSGCNRGILPHTVRMISEGQTK